MVDAHWQIYVTWIITALAGAFGIGVGYAVLKTDLSAFKNEVKTYKDTASAAAAAAAIVASEQLVSIKERVSKVEDKMEFQVGYDRCKDMRGECNDRVLAQLKELNEQIKTNRETVIGQMRETEKFIGRLEQYMLKNGVGK
jgi:hypothetical protein